MKHKLYRFLTLLAAVLLIAGAVCTVRMVTVRATEDPTEAPTEAPITPEPTTPAPTTPEPTTPEPTTPEPTTPEPTTPEPTTDPPTESSDETTSSEETTPAETTEPSDETTAPVEETTEAPTEHVHSFGEWVVITEASYETTGLKKRTCSGCGAEETAEIPAIGYPEGSVVDVVFTVTGGKFADGSTQKNVPVIKYEGSTPSRNGVGHLTAAQIPTDMIPDEGYDNGFWGDPEPTTSYNITGNVTFAFSYTGTFNYNGTYTSYNGQWRPTTPQGPTTPTQPRPTTPTQPTQTQPTTDNPSDGSETPAEELEFTLVNGEAGDYGELITVGGENFWAYHIPSYDYIAVNEGTEPINISVYSDEVITNAEGKEVPAQQFANITLAPGASSEVIRMPEDAYVRLSEGATVRFIPSEVPYIPETTEAATDESVTMPPTQPNDPASESAEASETETSADPGEKDRTLVLWPFILVISLLLVGLGVLIFFIVRLLKKSDGDEAADEASDNTEDE